MNNQHEMQFKNDDQSRFQFINENQFQMQLHNESQWQKQNENKIPSQTHCQNRNQPQFLNSNSLTCFNKNELANYKITDMSEVCDYMQNDNKYNTEIKYAKCYENGKELVRGFFLAESKNLNPNIKDYKDERTYYANNKEFSKIQHQKQKNIFLENLMHFVIIITFIALFFITIDFYLVYRDKIKEANAKKTNCYADFLSNQCDKLDPQDPKEIRQACLESKICMDTNTVLFQDVFIFYAKNFFSRLFGSIGFEGIGQIFFILIGTGILIKILIS